MARKDKTGTKLGRNDPCPCGSGKKYKQCCLLKEKDAAQERRAATSSTPAEAEQDLAPPPTPPLTLADTQTARDDPFEPLWNEFNDASYADKITWIFRTLDNKEVELDSEIVFDLFEKLYSDCIENDDRAHFNEIAEHLRKTRSALYAEQQAYLLGWMIENAYCAGNNADVARYFLEFSEIADRNIDLYFRSLAQVEYHGDLNVLTKAVDIAWPNIQHSHKVMQWGIDEFADKAIDFHIFCRLESNAQTRGDEPELLDRLAIFCDPEPDVDRLVHYLDWVTGRTTANWTEADFSHKNKQCNENLGHLSLQFLSYLRHTQQIPYSKAELARAALTQYFVRRHHNELNVDGRKPKIRHPLCPDEGTFDRYLGGMMQFLNRQDFKVVALFEIVPTWLRFLLDRGLLSDTALTSTLHELQPLHQSLVNIYGKDKTDPTLLSALEGWPYTS